jgi:hypothetical protein
MRVLNNYYPSYLAGGAILASIDIVRKFNIAFPYVKHLYIDDTYLGVVAKLLCNSRVLELSRINLVDRYFERTTCCTFIYPGNELSWLEIAR